jgi:hypothetical protein
MTKKTSERLFLTMGLIAVVPVGLWLGNLAKTYTRGQQQVSQKAAHPEPPASDPIVAIGHGSVVGRNGKNIELTAPFIEMVQEFYVRDLLAADKRRDKKKHLGKANIEATRRAIAAATDDKTLANALLIDWLVEKVKPPNRAHVTIANNALRWHYVLKIQKNSILPHKNAWGKGLKPDVAKRLEKRLGIKVFAATNAGGAAYCDECLKAGVPVPKFMFGPEWRFVDVINDPFLSPGLRAELWLYESNDPPGVCVALPRFGSDGKAQLFGVICLGRETSKACFFDNPVGVFFDRGVPVDFKTGFVGGTDLVANGQGVCSDCHAGENPYVVHPEKSAFSGVRSKLQSLAWHNPLVDASWPQNPGPTTQLDAVASAGRCDSCHQVGIAGRFPEVSSQLTGYCAVVLRTAAGTSAQRTMPVPVGVADRNLFLPHINSLLGSCDMPPSGGGVVVPVNYEVDPGVLSPPIVIDPLYQCATSVAVRGAVLDAKVTLLVNGAPVGTPIARARNTQRLEFTGLPALVAGQKVTARQEMGGTTAESDPVTVRDHQKDFPAGLPAPTIDPDLVYECAEVISVRHVPGAKVTIFSNGVSPVTGSGSTGWTVFMPGKRPFAVGDQFTAQISLCDDTSLKSVPPVGAVAAPRSIPAARFKPPTVFEGQELVTLEGLTNGARTEIALVGRGLLGAFSYPVSWYPDFDVATPLGRPLAVGDQLTATQTLCKLKSVVEGTPAKKCAELPAPRIQHPIIGSRFVVVTESVPGARVRVYDAASKEIGDGSGTVIVLTRAITGTDTLTVVQQVGKCTSKTGYRVSGRNPTQVTKNK